MNKVFLIKKSKTEVKQKPMIVDKKTIRKAEIQKINSERIVEKNRQIEEITNLFIATIPMFREKKPMRIGINREFYERFPALSHRKIQYVLEKHAEGSDYLKNVAIGTYRYDLNGLECEKISDTDKEFSLKKLLEAN